MRNLLDFVVKHYFFFLFLLLESIAFALFIQNNYYQRAGMINSTLEFTGFFHKKYSNFVSYFSLKEANQLLLAENARLRSHQPASFLISTNKIITVNDTTYRQRYEYVDANVVNNSVNKVSNFITLDKGSNFGIKNDMAVISSSGIVGIVKEVSPNFALVISVLNKDSKISAKQKKTNQVGTLVWEENDYRYATLKDIPLHISVNVGDTIATSGFSGIFPEGLPIGIVADYNSNKGINFYTIKVKLLNDFNNLSHVYIVKNLMKEEQTNLEEKVSNDK